MIRRTCYLNDGKQTKQSIRIDRCGTAARFKAVEQEKGNEQHGARLEIDLSVRKRDTHQRIETSDRFSRRHYHR